MLEWYELSKIFVANWTAEIKKPFFNIISPKQKNNVGSTTQPDKERALTDKQKKIRKLKNNPKLFFSDMAKKKIAIIRRFFVK